MFRRIRESQPGPTDPRPGTAGVSPRTAQDTIPREPVSQEPDLRPVATEQPRSFQDIAADVTRQILTPEQDGEARRRRRILNLKVDMHRRLLDELNLSAIEKVGQSELKTEILNVVRESMRSSDIVLSRAELERLCDELVDEVVGLGPLEPLLKDPSVTDILVNTFESCYVEREGRLEKTEVQFKDDPHLMRVINKIVAAVGRRVDESQPWVDARLADGSRVNALVPPCAVDGPLLSIRKFSKIPFTVDSLISRGAFSEEMALYMHACVRCKLNILVSGGTGSGKTTTLNALSSFIPTEERIVTIEDTAELQLQQEHVGRMESRPANIEGTGAVTQRDLLKNALRMRPDRIIVGEVRGNEVIDMLQAMNTGHDGSMTTLHANSARDALSRLENMVGMSGIELPLPALRNNISSALHVIVQVNRLTDGTRRMVSVSEVVSMEGEVITMQEIFRFERSGVEGNGKIRGRFVATGIRSRYADRFKQWGYELPASVFRPDL
ncbi:MAG: CpaF family protein [Pseudomonadota bacterium]